jgi:hypothetical protein
VDQIVTFHVVVFIAHGASVPNTFFFVSLFPPQMHLHPLISTVGIYEL